MVWYWKNLQFAGNRSKLCIFYRLRAEVMFSKAYVVILFTWGRVYLVPGSFQVLGPPLLGGGGVRVSVVPGPIFMGVGVGYEGELGYTYSPSQRQSVRILLECFLVAFIWLLVLLFSSVFICITGIPVTMGNLLHVKEFVQMGRNVIS